MLLIYQWYIHRTTFRTNCSQNSIPTAVFLQWYSLILASSFHCPVSFQFYHSLCRSRFPVTTRPLLSLDIIAWKRLVAVNSTPPPTSTKIRNAPSSGKHWSLLFSSVHTHLSLCGKKFLNFITSNYYNDFKFFYFNAFSQSGTKPKRLSNCAS